MGVYVVLFLIGFLNALHNNGNNVSIYLTECGYSKDLIGIFVLLGLPFSVKILWSAVIDYLPPPILKESPRKGWFMIALLGMALSFVAMAIFDPAHYPWLFASSLLFLALFAGCLYMVGIAYELESLHSNAYQTGSSLLITGYRIGLLYAGAGILYIAHLISWPMAFLASASCTLIALAIMLVVKEPYKSSETIAIRRARFSTHGIFNEIVLAPAKAFFSNSDWKKILAVILLFKLSDHMSKPMEGPFYLELGFTKQDLALAAKVFGFSATVVGAITSAKLLKNKEPFIACAVLGLLHTVSECGCFIHSIVGKSFFMLYTTSLLTNLTGGMAITAFISLLWKSCDKYYAPLQYAFLWSLSSIPTKLASCLGGFLAANMAWPQFFGAVWITGFIAALALLILVSQKAQATTAMQR